MRAAVLAFGLVLAGASAATAQTTVCTTDRTGRTTTCSERNGAVAPVLDPMAAVREGYEFRRRQLEDQQADERRRREEEEREAARTEALRQEYARKDAAARIGDLVARGDCAEAARLAIVLRDMQMVGAVSAVCKPAPQPQNQ